MKKTELRRKTEMPRTRSTLRTEPMQARRGVKRVAIRPRNHKRRNRLWEVQFGSAEFVAWMKAQPCAVCGERGPCHVSHSAKSRGAGGRWTDTIPLCVTCHAAEHHAGNVTFWKSVGLDPAILAHEYQARWLSFCEVYG